MKNNFSISKTIVCLIPVLILVYICFIYGRKREHFSPMLNIYDEPLQNCRVGSMDSGSWDSTGKCSEKGGGVHQICINNIANNTDNFSQVTGQTNWSEDRGNDNHCVCLGAWSLYNAKQQNKNKNKNVLKCEAIPKISLSKNYVSKFSEGWNKWNGMELNEQIIHGVNSLINNCFDFKNKKSKKSKNLKRNYCNFASTVNSLKSTPMYKKMCN